MDIDEGKTRPRKPNLAEIREKLPCKRTAERFTDYQGIMSDSKLDLMAKINHLQKAINDTTRRKAYFASLLGGLLESCFGESKEVYKRTLKEVKIKRQWAQFLHKLHKLVLKYNQLQYCMVSLRFIQINFKAMEEICESEPDSWRYEFWYWAKGTMSLRAHRFHHLWITFRVFLSSESVKLETSEKI